MTSQQPFPSTGQPNQGSQSGPDLGAYASVLGVQQQAARLSTEQIRKQQMDSLEQQVRSAGEMVDGWARQFPAAAQEAMSLKAGLTKLLIKVVGSSTPGSQPPTGALG